MISSIIIRMGGLLFLPALCGEVFWSAGILAALGKTQIIFKARLLIFEFLLTGKLAHEFLVLTASF